MRRLLGLRDFVHDAIDKTTDLVEQTHEAVASKPMTVLSKVPPLASAARAVNDARRLTAKAVFDGIRATNRSVQSLSDMGLSLAGQVLGQPPATPDLASAAQLPAVRTVADWADRAESALNAVAGDFLESRDNGLSIKMSIRREGRTLHLTQAELTVAVPHPTKKICVFVHGLGCSDSVWRKRDEVSDLEQDFARRLEREHGYTTFHLRYNTGLHISQNGRSLAQLVTALLAVYPEDVTDIALVGHSMGGLVCRSAAHYAQELGYDWVESLTHVLCIGSPHFGAPLEKAGNVLAAVLEKIPVAGTQVPAKILKARSVGIKDLAFGSVVDEDWLDKDPDAFFTDTSKHTPFVDGVTYGYVAARYRPGASSALGELLGDLLVQVPSASGKHRDPTRHLPFHMGHVLDGVHHVAMTRHPEVYKQLERFLTECRISNVRQLTLPH